MKKIATEIKDVAKIILIFLIVLAVVKGTGWLATLIFNL